MIITIDGPAGSGKSTAARELAARLLISYLDTGAMYRAIAYVALRRSIDLQDAGALLALASTAQMEVDCDPTRTRVHVDGQEVTDEIRTLEVSEATPHVARNQAIRTLMIQRQREIAARIGSLVTDGRDQGSHVFPNADIRFLLDASLETRAKRRLDELSAGGEIVNLEEIVNNLEGRDAADSKQWAPLLESSTATVVDTTGMSPAEVVDELANRVEEVLAGNRTDD